MFATVGSVRQVAGLNSCAEREPREFDCRANGLDPEQKVLHSQVRFGFIGVKSKFLDQTTSEPTEMVPIDVAWKTGPRILASPTMPCVEASVVPYLRVALTMWNVTRSCGLTSVIFAGARISESTRMAACFSGSVIGGRSMRFSMERSPRFCQIVSYSTWTCSGVGCAGISLPKRRRHSNPLSPN